MKISPKRNVENRWELTEEEAKELITLSMLLGKSMKTAMTKRDIQIERINFQDNGNWAIGKNQVPKMHLHLYGRAKNSKYQKRGEALYFPKQGVNFYKKLKPLNKLDIKEILKEITNNPIQSYKQPRHQQ